MSSVATSMAEAAGQNEIAGLATALSLGTLTASIVHEVNQPLSGIILNASVCLRMLAADPPNVSGALEAARRTIRDGTRASEVVTRMRRLFAKKSAASESVNLNELVQESIAHSSAELERSGVVLCCELADDLPLANGDGVQLQEVILNLIRNAIEAMSAVEDRPRRLVIRTERDFGNHISLSVEDSGSGFDSQTAERLFEQFYTTKQSGMGIGLFISRSIIESHHGRLWAAPNDGPGVTFSFSIPAARKYAKRPNCSSLILVDAVQTVH
jgi:signal transduction histidine kinase